MKTSAFTNEKYMPYPDCFIPAPDNSKEKLWLYNRTRESFGTQLEPVPTILRNIARNLEAVQPGLYRYPVL